jgi:hypothetical protein
MAQKNAPSAASIARHGFYPRDEMTQTRIVTSLAGPGSPYSDLFILPRSVPGSARVEADPLGVQRAGRGGLSADALSGAAPAGIADHHPVSGRICRCRPGVTQNGLRLPA